VSPQTVKPRCTRYGGSDWEVRIGRGPVLVGSWPMLVGYASRHRRRAPDMRVKERQGFTKLCFVGADRIIGVTVAQADIYESGRWRVSRDLLPTNVPVRLEKSPN
jgi:hypothetical protein